jgi:hypothetical protein
MGRNGRAKGLVLAVAVAFAVAVACRLGQGRVEDSEQGLSGDGGGGTMGGLWGGAVGLLERRGRGRVEDRVRSVHDHALREGAEGEAGKEWHLAHAPSDESFSVMHAKVYKSREGAAGDTGESDAGGSEASSDDADGRRTVGEMGERAKELLRKDGGDFSEQDRRLDADRHYITEGEEKMSPEERERHNKLEDEEAERRDRAKFNR